MLTLTLTVNRFSVYANFDANLDADANVYYEWTLKGQDRGWEWLTEFSFFCCTK